MVKPLQAIFTVARVLLGALGAWWLIAGLAGAVYAGVDEAWRPMAGAAIMALFGFCLAYGAFHHFPWERRPDDKSQAV